MPGSRILRGCGVGMLLVLPLIEVCLPSSLVFKVELYILKALGGSQQFNVVDTVSLTFDLQDTTTG